jgi:signal transduction histidine kinase
MKRLAAWLASDRRAAKIVVDALLVAVAAVDVWVTHVPFMFEDPWMVAAAGLGVTALLVRRRFPLLVLVATLPLTWYTGQAAAPLIALYTVGTRHRNRWLLGGCVLAAAVVAMWPLGWETDFLRDFFSDSWVLVWAAYLVAPAAAALFLGQLVTTKRELTRRLDEITEAREHEQLMATQKVLAQERAQLAREMHDVVSHQVSLIAVRAGALQVSTTDAESREAAGTIRSLSVRTLDELRHMVGVLRAGGVSSTELVPQPTLDQLERLVSESGIETDLRIGALPELGAPQQRAVYRTVQEALPTARKHAPGAAVSVRIEAAGGSVVAEIVNGPATRPTVPLPSSRHGLIGLGQRARFLDGELEYGPTEEGGWRVLLRFPVG